MDTLSALEETGAILRGHFLLSSGRHSDVYFEKYRLLERPAILDVLASELAQRFGGEGVGYVVGPTLGGMLVAYEVARSLGATALYLESEGESRVFRRGQDLPSNAPTLLVDDVLTTGLSLRECLPALAHTRLVGLGVLVSRSAQKEDWPARLEALLQITAESWAAQECPLCQAGQPLTERGSRAIRG